MFVACGCVSVKALLENFNATCVGMKMRLIFGAVMSAASSKLYSVYAGADSLPRYMLNCLENP